MRFRINEFVFKGRRNFELAHEFDMQIGFCQNSGNMMFGGLTILLKKVDDSDNEGLNNHLTY